ncbi:P-loop containing nucleoside triphosphate hydrolase protein [Lentinula edodes]|uniref:P-loop containing nucleoside triphosphate hydrolase protein n=1 Tax=Lentinula edodes TaxID=5353 RepID=UPI001E8E5AFE|nr:P-loop containing nucleoside triphosphate hydrolase protein [Lentinula edodes]KAH7869037.1 P-loop containing nucleoside triphosphate hydrolase protein [Lentinula edodes]
MSTQPVQIVARIRPPLLNEHTDDAISVVPIPADHTLSAARPIPFTSWVSVSSTGTKTGTTQVQNSQTAFHTAFGPDTTQLELFDTAVAPHLAPLLKGHTLTILAYGPTSSGKTHTMEGSPAEPGIIPRSVRVLFEMSEEGKESGMISKFEVHMSYLELYKDDAFDLLVSQRTHEKLPIRTNAKGETFVVGLTRVPIKSFDDWKNVFRTASQNRTTGATLLNRASSRSHAMLSIEVELIAAPTSETREMTYNGKINLVDLAGSENNKHTGNSLANPTRLAESAAINKSLSTLGQVVHALNTGASRIPYRDSNLTRLLSASLGGKALGKTILLCNLAPGVKFRSDVLNTLNFASRTKNIETKTVVNEREKPPPVEVVKEKEFLPTTGSLMRRTSIQSRRVSASHIPAPGSRIPSYGSGGHSRLSGFGLGPAAGVGGLGVKAGIDDADLNERINKAVEAEVKRRLEEKEAQRREEEEAREKQLQQEKSRPHITSSSSSTSSKQEAHTADVIMEMVTTENVEEKEIIEVEVEEAEVETELLVVEAMDVDQNTSPMKVDSVGPEIHGIPGDSDDNNNDEEKLTMDDIERNYKEHIAHLEAQLAAASSSTSTSAAASASSSAFIADDPPSMFSASTSSSTSLSISASAPGTESMSMSSSAHISGTSDILRNSQTSLTAAAAGLLDSTDDAESVARMSLAERKKMGKIYVDLARGYSAKNDLATALSLYRHAALFVPDNTRLSERIIDVEWAVRNGKSYVPTPKRQHPREGEELKLKSKSSRSSKSHRSSHSISRHEEMSKENSSSNSNTNSESPRKSSSADTRLESERTSQLSLTGSKRKRSVSREPADHSDSEYVFIPPLSSSTSHGHGFGKDLGNIDEEVEAETETAEAEADEFGVTRVAKVLRRSPRKKQLPQQVSTITTLGTMKSPSTVSDKRKMLGMSLNGKTGVGGVDISGSVYRTPSGGIGGTTTPKRGHVNGSERKTRKVSDLVYSGLGGLGFSGRGFGRDEDGVGDVDVEIHGKQKRARLD